MKHYPVLLNESIDLLGLKPGNIVLDATLGAAGHSKKIVELISPGGKLIGIDKDQESLSSSSEELLALGFDCKYYFKQSDFKKIGEVLDSFGISKIDAALFDLGVSSMQLDNASRGFSIKNDGPLDMRMDNSKELTAEYVINRYPQSELERILKEYGEERHAMLIARKIVDARKEGDIKTTFQLRDIIHKTVVRYYKDQKIHPCTRSFQAVRIEVNDELTACYTGINDTLMSLNSGGRMAVISFHSLEDRMVKNIFKDFSNKDLVEILTRKPITPTDEEIFKNTRSRSAKLRAIRKT
ncbi:MAG: 16S rRNA (cytosine(1402)-N(4))-methyltransferase RsmH [Candidatus Omnitrophica bacterium]|nr:16S rRNA (cytosine(1402)-N(4))-methyltransferase RsmH [Candidatus Omnitrophota bacterium]